MDLKAISARYLSRFVHRRKWLQDASHQHAAEIGSIYEHAAALNLTDRNPIVFIPGVMGSKLVETKSAQSVWGEFNRSYVDPTQGANRRLIALPMERGVPLDRLKSTTEADGTVAEARPRRLPVAVGAYRDILQTFGVSSSRPSSRHRPDYGASGTFASFEFGYDWRRSLDETARSLEEFLRLATYFVQAIRGNCERVKFDVVAHSMGGLVLRYYLRYGGQRLPYDGSLPRITWAGCERISRAIIIGTPNAGSVLAIDRLVNGLPAIHLVHPGLDPFIVGTMPAIYQLLPRTRHRPIVDASGGESNADLFDPEFWSFMGWGLAGADGDALLTLQLEDINSPAERRHRALDHLEKCLLNAKIFHQSLDIPAQGPSSLELHLIAGDAIATAAAVMGSPGEKRIRFVRYGAGDGTVLRSSALLDERVSGNWKPGLKSPIAWSSVVFAESSHMALTRDRVVINNVLFRLLENPRK